MKMFNKTVSLLLATASMMFISCGKDVADYTPGQYDGSSTCKNVSFETNGKTIELDPAEETTYSFVLSRRNSEGECVVPLEILKNTDNVFKVGEARFADGEDKTNVRIDFPDAKVGVKYDLELTVKDKDYVSSYSDSLLYKFTVTRVKWESLGMGTMKETFIFSDTPWPVEIMVNAGDPTQFRVINPFALFAEGLDGNQSDMISMRVLKAGETYLNQTIGGDNLVVFNTINSGYFHSTYEQDILMYHPSAFTSYADQTSWIHNKVLAWQEDKISVNGNEVTIPGQIQLAPYYYMNGVGGWDQTSEDDMIVITFPGFTPVPDADIEADFDWEEVFTGAFESGKLGKSSEATLFVGTCTAEQEETRTNFEEKYGTVYTIQDPYAEDYNLRFCVNKNGKIVVPEGYELQETGIKTLNTDLYAQINASESSVTMKDDKVQIVSLNITFTDKNGEFAYGPATDEVLSNITWTNLGTGLYTDNFIAPLFGVPVAAYEVEILERDDMPGLYRVMNPYSNSVYPYADDDCAEEGLYLEINACDPDGVYFAEQELGFDFGYGPFAIVSEGGRYLQQYDFDLVKKNGLLGTLKDGVITLPKFDYSNGQYQGIVYMGEDGYYGGTDGEFKVVLPSAYTPEASAKANVKGQNVKKTFCGKKTTFKKADRFAKKAIVRVTKNSKPEKAEMVQE